MPRPHVPSTPAAATMGSFFKEYWIWIVGPIVLVLAGVAAIYLLSGPEGDATHMYGVF